MVAIAVAGALGFYAIREFSESHATPRLRLAFYEKLDFDSPDPGTDLLRLPSHSPQGQAPFFLRISNDGNAVAVWYQIQFRATFMGYPNGDSSVPRAILKPVLGQDPQNWKYFSTESGSGVLDGAGFTFMSGGTIPVYPGGGQVLAEFQFPSGHPPHPGRHVCKYEVISDRSEPRTGVLHLEIVNTGVVRRKQSSSE